jgi:major membrane immunogen (membrane-anchored lipoprotein)
MRKLLSLLLVLVMMSSLFIGCAKKEDPVQETTAPATTAAATTEAPVQTGGDLADGIYFATEDGFSETSGWKGVVTLEVKDGNIVSVDWNGANISAGKDKKTTSKDGEYNMVAFGKAISEWHEQAALAEAYLLENQSFEGINYTDSEGHTDTIAGVTIHINDFEALVNAALAAGPVGTGKYVDGTFFAEEANFGDSGWKDNASFTVINGFIVAANWNGTSNASTKDKKATSLDGEYKMVEFGKAQAEWHEQVALVEGYVTDIQDLESLAVKADGKTDAVAGVSITVGGFVELAKQALKLR